MRDNVLIVERSGFYALAEAVHRMLLLPAGGGTMAVEYEGDLDLGGACEFSFDNLTTHTPEFGLIGQTYKRSVQRVISLGWLPAEMAYWSAFLATIAAEAKKRSNTDILTDGPYTEEMISQFNAIFAEQSPFKGGMSAGGQTIFEFGCARVKTILRQDELLANTTHLRIDGLEAILFAMVTSAYAALETMASDLWVAVVNKHPTLAGNWIERSKDKQINLAVVQAYNFDMSGSMGKILTENRKVQFQSFHDIKEAYQNTLVRTWQRPLAL